MPQVRWVRYLYPSVVSVAKHSGPVRYSPGMKIILTSVMVDNQERALAFYTGKLGFVKKEDFSVGENFRWLTVISPEGAYGVELALEPLGFAPAVTWQKALREAGIPATAFGVEDAQKEYERLKAAGVVFTREPMKTGPVTIAVFEDTCGNLLQMVQR